jgi:UDP-2,3-diacylglucosamine pyrophosphatase LpxH
MGYKRLIISDLHLGSQFSREEEIFNFISSESFDEIILAGDIIDFIKIPTFTEYSGKIFSELLDRGCKIIYIVGNHDISFNKFIGQNYGSILFTDRYEFEEGGRKFRVEHGDKYEKGIVRSEWAMNFISVFVNFIERYVGVDLTALYEKYRNKKRKLIRIWDIIKWNEDADVFIMGHTHIPEVLIWVDKNENIKTYVNTGDWVQHRTYVAIEDGEVRLKNFGKGRE